MAKRRKRGEGSVYLRKDGRWEGRTVVGYDEKGLPKTKNVLAKTKGECVNKLKALKAAIEPQTPEKATPAMTVSEWLTYWLDNHAGEGLRPSTRQRYGELICDHIIPEIGDIPLRELSRSDLQQMYLRLKESGRKRRVEQYGPGLSDRTIRNCRGVCRTALEKAVAEGLILRNPALRCRLPPSRPKEMQVLTPEEIQRLLIQAKEEGYYELFLLELSTGLRRGEILALQWGDLNFKTGELRIERQVNRVKGELIVAPPKTKASNRCIVLPGPVLAVLSEYRRGVSSRWMFPSPVKEDAPMDPAAVRKRLSMILDHAGCKHIRFHDLRHVFATNALESGMDIKTLSTIIGHVSTATTLNVYAHVTDEMRWTAAVKIDRGIAGVEAMQEKTEKEKTPRTSFQAYKGKRRRSGTGCISRIDENLWEGRYSPIWPDGKKHPRNIYAHSEEECEKLLAEMIVQVKAEIAAEKERLNAARKAG